MFYQGVSNCHYSWESISVGFRSSSGSLQRSGTPQYVTVVVLPRDIVGLLRGLESSGSERLYVSQRQRGR